MQKKKKKKKMSAYFTGAQVAIAINVISFC
jgi:hypothetical protein